MKTEIADLKRIDEGAAIEIADLTGRVTEFEEALKKQIDTNKGSIPKIKADLKRSSDEIRSGMDNMMKSLDSKSVAIGRIDVEHPECRGINLKMNLRGAALCSGSGG